jgi:hypothetical protein
MRIWSFINGWICKGARSKASTFMCFMAITFSAINTAAAERDVPPDPELLEFLADSVLMENEVIDPVSYSEIDQMSSEERKQQIKPDGEHE